MDEKRKDHLDPKRSLKKNLSRQLQIDDVPTDDWKILTEQNRKGDIRFANKLQTVHCGMEGMAQGHQRNRRATTHWSTRTQKEENETKKSGYGVDWQQKGIWWYSLQSWIIDCLKIWKLSGEVRKFIENTIDNYRVELIAGVNFLFYVDELYCELNYHDQKIWRTLTCDIGKHWTGVSTLLGLISSVYRDLHLWR